MREQVPQYELKLCFKCYITTCIGQSTPNYSLQTHINPVLSGLLTFIHAIPPT